MASFLDLPPEVRVMIYNLLLIPEPGYRKQVKLISLDRDNASKPTGHKGWDSLEVVCVSTKGGYIGTKNVKNISLGHGCLRSSPTTSLKFATLSQLFHLAVTNKEIISREALPVVFANIDPVIYVDEVLINKVLIKHVFTRFLSTGACAGIHNLRISLRHKQSINDIADMARLLTHQLPNLKVLSLFLRTYYISGGGRWMMSPSMERSAEIEAYFPAIQGLAALNKDVDVVFELQPFEQSYKQPDIGFEGYETTRRAFEFAAREEAGHCRRHLLRFRKIALGRAEAREEHDEYCVDGSYLVATLPLRLQ